MESVGLENPKEDGTTVAMTASMFFKAEGENQKLKT